MSEFYGDLTVAGATDCMTRFELRDSANDPITDAVAADLTATYQIDPDDTPVSISLSDLGSIGAAHTDGGVIHIAAGVYRLDLPDAVLAAGVAGKRPLISIVHADATLNYLEPVVAFTPTSNQAAIGSLNDLSPLAAESAAQVGATNALNNYDPPTKGELDAAVATLATAAALGTVDGIVDSILAIAQKLDDTLEDDGGTYRFTANALEQAPAGGGGGGDATEANQLTLLARLTAARAAKLDLITAGSVTVVSPVSISGNAITARIADSWEIDLEGLGDLTSRDDLLFQVTAYGTTADSAALLTLSEDDGLTRIAGETYATAADGDLTVTDENAGDITITIADEATAGLTKTRDAEWAVKLLRADGTSETLATGSIDLIAARIHATAT